MKFNRDGGYVSSSEMGYMFYNNLGGSAGGTMPSLTFVDGNRDNVSFQNLQPDIYWSLTEYLSNPGFAWLFGFYEGVQAFGYEDLYSIYAWAVRDGDVILTIDIDIKPGDDTNIINVRGMETIPVAILSSDDFIAPTEVDQSTLTFGPTGGEASPLGRTPNPKDVNGDGKPDPVCQFSMKLKEGLSLFECGDTVGILRGETTTGIFLEGQQAVAIAPCK